MKIRKTKKIDETASSMVEKLSPADQIVNVIIIILCGLIAFCCVVPMWHVLMSSISDGKTLMTHEGLAWLPVGKATLDGYKYLFSDSSVITGYVNSLIYTVCATALGFFVSATAGYALSRDTKLKKFMILFQMFTLMFNGGMVPTYMVIRKLGWVGTRWALIIPGCTNAMFTIMMMNAFNSVPKEMYEAARIDGASHFCTLFKVMLPQAMNLGAVVILNNVIMQWNAWFNASIYVPNDRELWPLQLVIKQLTADNANFLRNANPNYSRYLLQYAVIIAAILPIIIALPFFQDKLEKGVITGGVKG